MISSTITHIFVPKMLEEFQLAVGAFGEDRGGKGLHDLLDRDGLLSELVFGGARILISILTFIFRLSRRHTKPDQMPPCPQAADLCI